MLQSRVFVLQSRVSVLQSRVCSAPRRQHNTPRPEAEQGACREAALTGATLGLHHSRQHVLGLAKGEELAMGAAAATTNTALCWPAPRSVQQQQHSATRQGELGAQRMLVQAHLRLAQQPAKQHAELDAPLFSCREILRLKVPNSGNWRLHGIREWHREV